MLRRERKVTGLKTLTSTKKGEEGGDADKYGRRERRELRVEDINKY